MVEQPATFSSLCRSKQETLLLEFLELVLVVLAHLRGVTHLPGVRDAPFEAEPRLAPQTSCVERYLRARTPLPRVDTGLRLRVCVQLLRSCVALRMSLLELISQ